MVSSESSIHDCYVRCTSSAAWRPFYRSNDRRMRMIHSGILFLSIPPFCYIFALLFSLLVTTQVRGHITGSSPLHPTVRTFHFDREKTSTLSSLVDSRSNCVAAINTVRRPEHVHSANTHPTSVTPNWAILRSCVIVTSEINIMTARYVREMYCCSSMLFILTDPKFKHNTAYLVGESRIKCIEDTSYLQ